jgi:hypothetical protein
VLAAVGGNCPNLQNLKFEKVFGGLKKLGADDIAEAALLMLEAAVTPSPNHQRSWHVQAPLKYSFN